MDRNNNTDEYICSSSITKNYGIPKRFIEKYLKTIKIVPNPHYKCSSPMRLYLKTDVENILLKQEDVIQSIENHNKRSVSAKKMVETKLAKIRILLEKDIDNITVELVDDTKLEKNAIEHYNDFESYKECNYNNYISSKYINDKTISDEFKNRIIVNYIRHELTVYDENLWNCRGVVGKDDYYKEYKTAVLDKISEVYPKYKSECERQKKLII